MHIVLSGKWNISLEAEDGAQTGQIQLPGILQAAGYGDPITRQTPWVSSLHDTFWYQQEEYRYAQEEGVNVPFLSQPPRHFLGEAVYERDFQIPVDGQEWYFYIEVARWRSRVWIDGVCRGEDCTLCGPHHVRLGVLSCGRHTIRVAMDNSMIYPYRPDAHGVSDALGGTWNGMVGEIALMTEKEYREREAAKSTYAAAHPRTVEASGNQILIDGKPFYFRATHFGGDYPLIGHPETGMAWWRKLMGTIQAWGLNGIRFHSYCPPEAAFAAADEAGVCLLVECGMWNRFGDSSQEMEMYEVLMAETRRILDSFGHHPSFVFFSPSNEPGGAWYKALRRWVREAREYDETLGYGGRRLYTAQSGWFYDVPPAGIQGTDFIYFHRSGYGPYLGGTIRNPLGWRGGNYSPSLEGVKKPVICHELGQICAYPDYGVIRKFKGYLQPGNYRVFQENARANGILPYAEDFVRCSGENQLRLYKEELEANCRTPQIQGFELLDLHDYLGQGTALVGILDSFWESKGYGSPEAFREFCGDTVLLARCSSYVWRSTDRAVIPVEVCHYGKEAVKEPIVVWTLRCGDALWRTGELRAEEIPCGCNTEIGDIIIDFREITREAGLTQSRELELMLELLDSQDTYDTSGQRAVMSRNRWSMYVFLDCGQDAQSGGVLYTRDWAEARRTLEAGGRVVFSPYLSDLGYECPALSARSVDWNGQMGPSWRRTMGIVVREGHPVFRHFPTGRSGGWQWEDILEQARGFWMEGLEQVEPIVQPIDDWNRNLLQSLLFEAKVLGGSLLLVSANLEGSFEERPGAYCLKQAILRYASSEDFAPSVEARAQSIEAKLFPMLRMGELTEKILYSCSQVRNGGSLVTADPNSSVRAEAEGFPIEITILLCRPIAMRGILYVPEQRDRGHEGFVRDYAIEIRHGEEAGWESAAQGTLQNTCRSQKIAFDRVRTGDAIRLKVFSAYGCVDKYVWRESCEGWHRVFKPLEAVVQIAGLHVLCEEDGPHGDIYASGKARGSRTKEIDF